MPLTAVAQPGPSAERGAPVFYQHFTAQDYRADPRNWAITEDERGLIYVGNGNGVLEYDGERWRLIETFNRTVRSLASGQDGRIYVGASADFGYLAPDTTHTYEYVSLIEEVSTRDYGFNDVWGTHIAEEGVYFQSRTHLFRWDGDGLEVWESEEGFHTTFMVDGTLYVREVNRGLLQMKGDSLQIVPGGERFADQSVFVMEEYDADRLLVGTRQGFFLYDGTTFTSFPTQLDPYLEEYSLYHGTFLKGGGYALSLLGGGVYVIDEEGQIEEVLSESRDLPENGVNYVFQDSKEGLWLALHNEGIVRADVRSSLSMFDSSDGLSGIVENVERHNGDLYVATGSGVFRLRQAELARLHQEAPAFEAVPDIIAGRVLLSHEELLVGADRGVFRWNDAAVEQIGGRTVYSLHRSEYLRDRVLVGRSDGLALLHPEGDRWELEKLGLVGEIRSIVEPEDGVFWLGRPRQSVLRVHLGANGELRSVERYGAAHGLPDAPLYVSSFQDEVVVVTREGVLRFDEDREVFYPDSTLVASQGGQEKELLSFVPGNDEQFWLTYRDRVEVLSPRADGTYRREVPTPLRFPRGNYVYTYLESDGVTWLGNDDALIRYDPRYERTYDYSFPVYVREIKALATETAIYGGAPVDEGATIHVPYEQRTLSMSYAAPDFNRTQPLEYQYRLVGRKDEWSEWTATTQQTFADLWEGDYRFEVRARNERGIVTEKAAIDFKVLPPWYRTAWAYLIYVIAAVALIAGARRYRQLVRESQRAKRQAKELANERLANERLRQANESLEQANKLKDNFLANTSHELRTPLTAILGFTSVLREELSGEHVEFLNIIEENGERLLRTLNSLLDIAKIRAGVTEISLEQVDVREKARRAVCLLQSLAERKGLSLRYEQPDEPVFAMLDAACLDRVLQNLIGNAIKFTEEGEVVVEVLADREHAKVRIRDTGIGIREEFIPHLFEEFKQESTGISRTHEGSGLGLAITARLVELMEGDIEVESTKGEGSVFTVVFPRCMERKTSVTAS